MIFCDENIKADQVQLFRASHFHTQQIGAAVGRKGMLDAEIVPFLRSLRRPTLVTWDAGFYRRSNCHPRYCILFLDVSASQVAAHAIKVLRDRRFATAAARMGKVIRITRSSVSYWQFKVQSERRFSR